MSSLAPRADKAAVKEHWEREVCGSRYGLELVSDRVRYFEEIERTRYQQDYMLRDFARFHEGRGKKVLEVGLGTGTDFLNWVKNGAIATGRDLTAASVRLVKERLELYGLEADVAQGDAENLEFPDNTFDIYYSWGVLHHTPDFPKTIAEAYRVLKPGGSLRIMLYHKASVATLLVWLVYGPMKFRLPSFDEVLSRGVESPGTKAYNVTEIESLLRKYFDPSSIGIRTWLGSGDLLTHRPSEKYSSPLWRSLIKVYPTWFVRRVVGHRFGSVMTVEAKKASVGAGLQLIKSRS